MNLRIGSLREPIASLRKLRTRNTNFVGDEVMRELATKQVARKVLSDLRAQVHEVNFGLKTAFEESLSAAAVESVSLRHSSLKVN
jgi:hypothetical protein